MSDLVLAAHKWPSNAEMIEDCVRLGYLKREWRTLDPTYGRGVWWKNWSPDVLVKHDRATLDGIDFRRLPHDDESFDAVAFDPPYVCIGGRKTSTMVDFNDRFGLESTPRTPPELQEMINGGVSEAWRVLRPQGFLLAKCQDYVSGGRVWWGTDFTTQHAESLGFVKVDRLEFVASSLRPQPRSRWDGQSGTKQEHARRNLSTLLVFKKPGRRKK